MWLSGSLLALGLLVVSSRAERHQSSQRHAYRAAIGALVLATMAIEIPFGPLEYHLTLVGPVGVLLGPAGAFQVVFVASTVLAFLGHGGFTVVGLNALVLGAGAAIARPIYRAIAGTRSAPLAMALGTALGQAAAGLLWLGVMGLALRWWGSAGGEATERLGLFSAVVLPMWLVGIAVESVVAFGIGRFLVRVRPDLLPAPARGGGSVAESA